MTTKELDRYFRSFLDIEGFLPVDDSLNGLQVDNDGSKIQKVAFAVDACLETFARAAAQKANLLFVHHGLFWGKAEPIKASLRERLKTLLDNNIALYGVHLPLDAAPNVGNNAVLAELLGLENLEPFGMYHGRKIGYKGTLKTPLTIEEVQKKISFMGRPSSGVYPFGKKEISTCAVVSGGAAMEVLEAINEGIDAYVTGETSHSAYHYALEAHINVIAGGHYNTEVRGVRKVMEKLGQETNLEVEFLDVPTGL